MDIVGRAGLFLAGKVSPELQGVEISISERGAATPLITVATDETGAYRYSSRDRRPFTDGTQTQVTGLVGGDVGSWFSLWLLRLLDS